MDIHNHKRSFERIMEKIKESDEISEENEDYMLRFKDYLLSENILTSEFFYLLWLSYPFHHQYIIIFGKSSL
ncbi:hypothetical protein CMI38_01780 [Candidatus Pacearchaeota archaeon]|nr:hypothetical protein [Candidatus Pacearchaeota archaeon]